MLTPHHDSRRKLFLYAAIGLAVLGVFALSSLRPTAQAQDGSDPEASANIGTDNTATDTGADTATETPPPIKKPKGLKLFDLLLSGGVFMLPLVVVSIMVVTFSVERFIALRRSRVLPAELVAGLGQLGGGQGGFDPRKAYRMCQQFPSAAATVIRSMLLKVGRPHSELEHTVMETSQREADRMFTNVRWLTLAAGVAPLLGLLGTVWGMIIAFHDTAQLDAGQNKAEALAEGIYVALVTTLAGLSIAIPAAVLAHYFEGRITLLFHQIDELLFNLLPQVERYEGRVRFNRPTGDGELPSRDASPEGEVVEARVAPVPK